MLVLVIIIVAGALCFFKLEQDKKRTKRKRIAQLNNELWSSRINMGESTIHTSRISFAEAPHVFSEEPTTGLRTPSATSTTRKSSMKSSKPFLPPLSESSQSLPSEIKSLEL